jgi:uracil-DNA glycosylase
MQQTLQNAFEELVADTRALLLAENARGVQGFPLKDTEKSARPAPGGVQPVAFSSGADSARLLILGHADAPDQGLPNGEAGQMLAKMLDRVLGVSPETAHYLNVNPVDKPEALPGFLAQLEDTVNTVGPKVIVTMGQSAVWAALGPKADVSALRGQWSDLLGVPMLTTFHPRFLIAHPEFKRLVFRDLQQARHRLDTAAEGA